MGRQLRQISANPKIEELSISGTLINHDKSLNLTVYIFSNSVCYTKAKEIYRPVS